VTAVRFDLQSHSRYSDGALAPEEVVTRAAAAGVELLALSDHDTVEGVVEALQAGRRHGVVIIPAVEITVLDGERQDLHLLAYGIDYEDSTLLSMLAASRADRDARVGRMADALRQRGWAIDERPLQQRRASGRSVGRPHLAAAVFAHPDNAERLRTQGLSNSTELLVAELVEGAPSYRGRTRPTISDAIAAIHAADGLAVWAHPFWDITNPGEVLDAIDRFAAQGLDGVEAFYVTFTREQTLLLADACAQRGLLSTGSADFHGPEHPRFSAFAAFDLHGRDPNLGALVAGTRQASIPRCGSSSASH
jgi:predicted metal-dependent phosphoesterase TrpH